MLKLENHLGVIEISEEYFANLIGHAVSECFGVAGMVSSGAVQGLRSALSKEEFLDKGVAVKAVNGKLVVDLHIAVTYGLNIATIVRSIVGRGALCHRKGHRPRGRQGQCLRGSDDLTAAAVYFSTRRVD